MTHFIVIGTNDKVKDVVDEIEKSARLQHNVVSSGRITSNNNGNHTYIWTPLGDCPPSESTVDDTSHLREILKNHLANFGSVVPANISLRVLLVSNYMDDDDVKQLDWIITELLNATDAAYPSIQATIALVAYDQTKCHTVTLRPEWKRLKELKRLLDRNVNIVNLLYINNVDVKGGATDVNDKLLARFLSYWVTMSDNNAAVAVNTQVYSVGLAEYQYNFDDLAEYFKNDVEARLLERKLNAAPSEATAACIESNRLSVIKLEEEWLDGLRHIEEFSKAYCSTEYDFAKSKTEQPYCVQRQMKEIVDYLHHFIRLFIRRKEHELEDVKAEISEIEKELNSLTSKEDSLKAQGDLLHDEEEEKGPINAELINVQNQKRTIEQRLLQKTQEKEDIEKTIADNTYQTLDEIARINPSALVTDSQIADYDNNINRYRELELFVASDAGYNLMINEAEKIDDLKEIPCYPKSSIEYIGIVNEPTATTAGMASTPQVDELEDKSKNNGCLPFARIVDLLGKKKEAHFAPEKTPTETLPTEENLKKTKNGIGQAVNALRNQAKEVEHWWGKLNKDIEQAEARKRECDDKVRNYEIKDHRKSRTLIDIKRAHEYSKEDTKYATYVGNVLTIWFNSTLKKRPTLDSLIEEKVISQLREMYSELSWDGKNPFVDENIDDLKLQEIINNTNIESRPFIQYEHTVVGQFSDSFYFNHPQIEKEPTKFRKKYHTSSGSISPSYYADFINSLCAVQIIGVKNPIKDIHDFKPKRETRISAVPADPHFLTKRMEIIGDAQEPKDIARRIYDWLCSNIQYDTTKTIHDADTCWRSKKGVCQAYCELFCHIAGDRLIAEIVTGKSKQIDGTIPETMHGWLFVYTDGYDGIFIDPTWGAGGITDGKFVKSVDRDVWFDIDPAWMIYTHYPEKEEWQKLATIITEEQFVKLPAKMPDNTQNAFDALANDLNTNP